MAETIFGDNLFDVHIAFFNLTNLPSAHMEGAGSEAFTASIQM